MWFKLTYSLSEIYLSRDTDVPVTIPLSFPEEVEITFLNIEDKNKRSRLHCEAVSNRKLNQNIASMFEKLAAGILPLSKEPKIELPYHLSLSGAQIDKDGKIPSGRAVPIEILPIAFQDISREMYDKLSNSTKQFVKTLCWRQEVLGSRNPFRIVRFEWSADKIDWHTMPMKVSAIVTNTKGIDLHVEAIEEVTSLLDEGKSEPLPHELIREAIEIAQSNPRSGLLIGVAALETALKEYISFLVPNSSFVLAEMPSPPALKMMQDVIPNIHKARSINVSGLPLSQVEKKYVEKWITQRNKVAHGANREPDIFKLLTFLKFVRNFLYKLDLYRGHQWVEPLISINSIDISE